MSLRPTNNNLASSLTRPEWLAHDVQSGPTHYGSTTTTAGSKRYAHVLPTKPAHYGSTTPDALDAAPTALIRLIWAADARHEWQYYLLAICSALDAT